MAELLFLIAVLMEEQEKSQELRRHLKSLRDSNNPFSMDEKAFIKIFRFPKSLCQTLIEELEPKDIQKTSIPFTHRFLACLNFYAHGVHQKRVGDSHGISLSQSSISRALHFVSKLIVDILGSEVHFPSTLQEVIDIKNGFKSKFGMKNIIGAIDCSHIGIIQPTAIDGKTPSLFMNRKGLYSINVEAVCDHRMLFTAVNARYPGCYDDSDIWNASPTRLHLKNKHNVDSDTFLLGDQGYPLEPWLLTPIADPLNPKQKQFNNLHGKACSTIKKAFGLLKSRFRCLSKGSKLHYNPERAAHIIYACTVLYNILQRHNIAANIDNEVVKEEFEEDTDFFIDDQENFDIESGEEVRQRYIMSQ